MRIMLALSAMLLSCAAMAADTRYAILTLVGDRMLVSRYFLATGSRLDRNVREFVEVPGPALERMATVAVDGVVRRALPGADPILLGISESAMYTVGDSTMSDALDPLVAIVAPRVRSAGATHLILLAKHRGDAQIRVEKGHIGSGTLEGLGFYLDATRPMRNTSNGERSEGFVAPFAYLRFALVEVATGRVVREERVVESQAVASQKVTVAWDALTAEQKAGMLQVLVRRAAAQAIPRLLAP